MLAEKEAGGGEQTAPLNDVHIFWERFHWVPVTSYILVFIHLGFFFLPPCSSFYLSIHLFILKYA